MIQNDTVVAGRQAGRQQAGRQAVVAVTVLVSFEQNHYKLLHV